MSEEKRRGHTIHISRKDTSIGPQALVLGPDATPQQGTEILIINGKPIPFTKSDQGYNIYYLPPAPSLIEAARNYVDIQREISE